MADARTDALLDHAAELERRDEELAERIALVAGLGARVDAVRSRADAVSERLAALPSELAAAEQAEAEARAAESEQRGELAEAERRLEQVTASRRASDEERAQAQRTAQDAREALRDAEHRVERLEARQVELRRTESELETEALAVGSEAQEVALALQNAPRVADAGKAAPAPGLGGIDEWGVVARAALFVARGVLEAERERVIAEANALAAAVLGEELPGSNVALVRRRVEDALA